MQNALQGLGLPVPPSLPQGEEDDDEEDQNENSDEEVEEEEEPEEQEEEGVVSVQQLGLGGKELVQSLNSSYEDLVVPSGDERMGINSPMMVVRRGTPGKSARSGEERVNEDGKKESGAKKDKARQDASSEPDIPIDSSAEEDAGKLHVHVLYVHVVLYNYKEFDYYGCVLLCFRRPQFPGDACI